MSSVYVLFVQLLKGLGSLFLLPWLILPTSLLLPTLLLFGSVGGVGLPTCTLQWQCVCLDGLCFLPGNDSSVLVISGRPFPHIHFVHDPSFLPIRKCVFGACIRGKAASVDCEQISDGLRVLTWCLTTLENPASQALVAEAMWGPAGYLF